MSSSEFAGAYGKCVLYLKEMTKLLSKVVYNCSFPPAMSQGFDCSTSSRRVPLKEDRKVCQEYTEGLIQYKPLVRIFLCWEMTPNSGPSFSFTSLTSTYRCSKTSIGLIGTVSISLAEAKFCLADQSFSLPVHLCAFPCLLRFLSLSDFCLPLF